MNNIVVLTPTYNRVDTLPKLYESLKQQNNKKFDWLIIDDGSIDNTAEYVNEIIKENIINIKYIYQENGGKVRALNNGFSSFKDALIFMIVDSDDYLLSTAIDTVSEYVTNYKNNEEVGALFFHYNTGDGKLLKPSGKILKDDEIMTRYQYNSEFKANDGCICYFNKVVSKYRYPEFENEKYVGPTVIQMDMANEYKIVFSSKVVGVADYLEGGLSKSGRKLRLKNPNGMIYYSELSMSRKHKFSIRIKNSISIWTYYKILNISLKEVLKKQKDNKIMLLISYLPGIILSYYWNEKYFNN